ncbi:MAG: 2-keto-3-deoxy-galactonokinase [Pricia sp.]|nr:2-keto-3-deoxy-galactonokinase [Pricia sp.]
MELPSYFISCDWGTSNFRLRLVHTASFEVLAEQNSNQGIKAVYERFSKQETLSQKDFFISHLVEHVDKLPVEHRFHAVVSSGMSTSNIGLYELPYSDMPFDNSGETLHCKTLPLREGQQLLLISGIKSDTGMMRGEEIQAIGLENLMKPYKAGILLLPGTHSKHLTYKNGSFCHLRNYMTGELFEILGQKSILAGSVRSNDFSTATETSFKEGLQLGLDKKFSSSLLMIRAKDVVNQGSKEENFYFLSGLLIGDELSYLHETPETIFLAAPKSIFTLYKIALESFLDNGQLVLFEEKILEKALLMGQIKILQRYAT